MKKKNLFEPRSVTTTNDVGMHYYNASDEDSFPIFQCGCDSTLVVVFIHISEPRTSGRQERNLIPQIAECHNRVP